MGGCKAAMMSVAAPSSMPYANASPHPGTGRVEDPALGTTIMAVEFDGGVILGADSRTSAGSYVANRVSDKITQCAERVYVCRSGSAADTQAVTDALRMYTNLYSLDRDHPPEVNAVANMLNGICYENKQHL